MAPRDALRLTWFDLILIGGIAIASLWAGRAAAAYFTDSLIGNPTPDAMFQIRYGVPSVKDSISLIERQQDVIGWQISLMQTLIIAERQEFGEAPARTAAALQAEIRSNSQLLDNLQGRLEYLGNQKDKADLALASDEYLAQRGQARSSSIRRISAWAVQAIASLLALALLCIVPFIMRRWIGSGVHPRPVIIGAAIVLLALLFTVYAGWVGVALLAIVIFAIILRGRRLDNV